MSPLQAGTDYQQLLQSKNANFYEFLVSKNLKVAPKNAQLMPVSAIQEERQSKLKMSVNSPSPLQDKIIESGASTPRDEGTALVKQIQYLQVKSGAVKNLTPTSQSRLQIDDTNFTDKQTHQIRTPSS